MADIQTTTENESGFGASNVAGDFEIAIDATGETGPSPNELLVADYASCFTFAFRAGAQRSDYDDLGRIETEAEADLDDEDDLLAEAEDICHVHAALREGLHADVTVEAGAF